MIESFVRTGRDSRGFEKKDDRIKSHVSKGMDRRPFSTLSKLLETGCLYKRYKWICDYQVRQDSDTR
jgi:hypothetical protein